MKRRWVLRALVAAAAVALVGIAAVHVAARLVPLPDDFFTPGSQVVAFEDGSFAHVFLSPDDKWRIPVRLAEVDPAYLQALLRLEDKRFYQHGGVDVAAVLRAAITNLSRGRVVSGASTLTMQLVRVREVRPRSLGSKVVEAFRALQLEARMSKAEILAAYLEYVPYGRNVEGLEAAALSYFGHRATALSAEEIATLLAVPQNPNARYPKAANEARLTEARDEIAARLVAWGALDGDAARLAEVRAAPVPVRLRAFPRLLPHAAYWLAARYPDRARIETTLQRGVQKQAEEALTRSTSDLLNKDIHHGAVVVVEHETAKVRALVGSFDFFADAPGSQIAGFDVPRSPGSALKPFIYGLALDEGLVLPEHLVLDVPVAFGTYVPKNYDGRFSGLVRAEEALSRSLNVPFVNLLHEVGVDRFVGHLEAWGVGSLSQRPGYYGLSAAIGGMELTPLELAGLYTMLAHDGVYRDLRWLEDGAPTSGPAPSAPREVPGVRGLSSGAAFLVQRALRIKDRPDFPARRRFTGVPPHIHWKTGTSYGHRDAWAAGSGARHTAVVWLGNFDQSPSAHLVGAEAAGPVLFDVLEGLEAGAPPPEPEAPPKDLTRVEVCAYSGHLPGPGCPHTTWVWARRQAVPTEPCPYHVALDVDDATGLALTPECREGRAHHEERFLIWPARLRRWLAASARHAPEPPAFHPDCRGSVSDRPPRILSPGAGQLALLIPGVAAREQEIPLAAESASDQLSWFVDGRFLGTVRADEHLWWTPQPGRHLVVVTDEAGRSAEQAVSVRMGAGGDMGGTPP